MKSPRSTPWKRSRLRFKASVNPKASAPLDQASEVSFIPMEAIGEDGTLRLNQTRRVADVSQGYTYFEEGDVSIAKITPCFENGKGGVMTGLVGGVGFGTTELIVMRPGPDSNAKFLYYLTASEVFRAPGEASMLGAGGQKRVSDLFVKDFETAWPPVDVQAEIASYLNVETARIDALIAEKKLLVHALVELKKSVVHEAITTGVRRNPQLVESGLSWISKIPKHWKIASLKRCVRLAGGHTPSTTNGAYWDGAVPWFSPKDMKSDELADSIDHVTEAAVFETGLSLIEPGTTMIVVRGMILAHTFPVCVTKVQGTLNQDMKALVPDETLEKLYLPWLLRGVASLFLSLTDQSGHGTMALRTDSFMSERLPIPPLDEQLEIVAHLDAERRRIDHLLAHVRAELDLLAELRSSTITDAVLGRIDVRTTIQNKKELEAA